MDARTFPDSLRLNMSQQATVRQDQVQTSVENTRLAGIDDDGSIRLVQVINVFCAEGNQSTKSPCKKTNEHKKPSDSSKFTSDERKLLKEGRCFRCGVKGHVKRLCRQRE